VQAQSRPRRTFLQAAFEDPEEERRKSQYADIHAIGSIAPNFTAYLRGLRFVCVLWYNTRHEEIFTIAVYRTGRSVGGWEESRLAEP
jgi:hypothetical protein